MDLEIEKIDLRKLNQAEIAEFLEDMEFKKFRAKQIYQWLWQKSSNSIDDMTNLSLDLRQKLKDHFVIRPIQLDLMQKSNDGTIKSRFTLHDGHKIESVLIPVTKDDRYTVCVSSQVGCSLTCKFCATGRMKRIRNLDPSEIYDQVAAVNQQCLEHYGKRLSNIVYMGMGEPLLAYKNVLKSVEYITSEKGLGFSPKRITVSTAGIAKMIKKLAEDKVKFNLALSLHAGNDTKRSEIMPINDQNNLETLMEAIKLFYQETRNQISYEYILLNGFNDTRKDAFELIDLTKHFPVKVNIINYNPIDEGLFERSDQLTTNQFASILNKNGVTVTVRKSRGEDIDAACGQLANKE